MKEATGIILLLIYGVGILVTLGVVLYLIIKRLTDPKDDFEDREN